ncbi:MAG TPA: pantoate--beta-alanine ligase [Chitinophagaceae bacterium]|nr:pantoate--beta-alanine ligase [Chitinophagaceae bacterium]
MQIFKNQKELQLFLEKAVQNNKTIGFVPTMGALHEGHLSLIEASKKENDFTLCSIFVNPTQFNNKEDLNNYPKDINSDIVILKNVGCDLTFIPSLEELYPKNPNLKIPFYELGYLDTILEAAYRPGHFQGVAHIMTLFLELIKPHRLYMGQKDYQQCMVVQKLLEKLHFKTEFCMIPIKREDDGLAMSSRNVRLNEFERSKASLIYQCLISIKAKKGMQEFSVMQKESKELMENKGLKVEYIQLADAQTLEVLEDFDLTKPMVVLIAAHLGNVRLIDNIKI